MTDLDDLAAEMRIVDLGDRVRRAHRRGVRRRVLAGGIAVLVLAVLGVFVAVGPGLQRVRPTGELDGTLVTVRTDGDELVVDAGDRELLRLPGNADSPVVSPDGDALAWRQPDGYYTAELDGGEPRKLAEDSDSCLEPVWAPDGEPLLLTGAEDGEIVWRDAESGDEVATLSTDRERSARMCRLFPVVRADSGYDLYYGTGFELRYLSPDGTFTDTGVMRELRDHGEFTALTGLSSDGTVACVRSQPGERRCDALIDVKSKRLLRELAAESAWFGSDGGLLTTGTKGELVLRDRDGVVVERAAAPASASVLAYLPLERGSNSGLEFQSDNTITRRSP